MWARLDIGGDHRLVAADRIIDIGYVSGTPGPGGTVSSPYRFQVGIDGLTSVTRGSSIAGYDTFDEAEQARDDLAKALASPQIVET